MSSPSSDEAAEMLLPDSARLVELPATSVRVRSRAAAAISGRYAPTLCVYLLTRLGLVAVFVLNTALRPAVQTQTAQWNGAWLSQVAHWDGAWYSMLALIGYPHHAVVGQSTLGFFPLYPALARAIAYPVAWFGGHGLAWSIPVAGFVISTVGGAVAAVLVQELARGWWGDAAGRRAAIFFVLFPGSVVFSMAYAEGLMLPLAAGCLLALERRRWWLAGALGALATATEPEALGLVLAGGAMVVREARRHGWRSPQAARSVVAPALSLTGIGALAVFLWAWTGTPLATLHAQHSGWGETTDGLALLGLTRHLFAQLHLHHFDHPTIDLNLVSGFLGAIVLVVLLVLLARHRRSVSAAALTWTAAIAFLAVTSEYIPPNPRLLITAFPAVLVVGRALRGRAYVAVAAGTGALLMVLSALTFVGSTLRP